ncbi:MAG: hypothetical protein GF329_14795 [Candidatus Lokiarchaeota archaeon]|nr:hypothetical protein [Candidatus Lokiarchaeota archaeon]
MSNERKKKLKKKKDSKNKKNKIKNILMNRLTSKNKLSIKIKGLLSPKNIKKNSINILVSLSLFMVVIASFTEPYQGSELSGLLIYTKTSFEKNFDNILSEIEENLLSDLIGENLPTSKEIFYAEWSNDWFPTINIAVVGPVIEELGAEKVGDIDIDGLEPYADLNMTTYPKKSNLTLKQCQALWDRKDRHSFVAENPVFWNKALDNDSESINTIITHFNLTNSQFELILKWLNTSSNGWMNNIKANVLGIKPIEIPISILFGILGAVLSFILCDNLIKKISKFRDLFEKIRIYEFIRDLFSRKYLKSIIESLRRFKNEIFEK